MHRTSLSASLLALAIVLSDPPRSLAQPVAVATGAFGHHAATTYPNFVAQPIGRAECDELIPFDFTGLVVSSTARYEDVWRSPSALSSCQQSLSRSTACFAVPVEQDVDVRWDGPDFTLAVTPRELFGDCATSTQTFWFFDSALSPDVSSNFSTFSLVEMVLDADAPSSPILLGSTFGGTEIPISWRASDDVGPSGRLVVYFDPDACGGADAGEVSTSLVAGGLAPARLRRFEASIDGITSIELADAVFGWSPLRYGEQGAMAITMLDAARNESWLSNVVCVAHTHATAIEAGAMADAGVGDGRYLVRACSTGGRPQPLAAWPMLAALAALGSRRRTSTAASVASCR